MPKNIFQYSDEEAALLLGLTVEQYTEYLNLRLENETLKRLFNSFDATFINDCEALYGCLKDDFYCELIAEWDGMTAKQFRKFERLRIDNAVLKRHINLLPQKSLTYEERADAALMSVEQLREYECIKWKNERIGAEEAKIQLYRWQWEAEVLSCTNPKFNLDEELKNPRFLQLLKAGIPVQPAYEVLHINEPKSGLYKIKRRFIPNKLKAALKSAVKFFRRGRRSAPPDNDS